jgi:hypothetical protein
MRRPGFPYLRKMPTKDRLTPSSYSDARRKAPRMRYDWASNIRTVQALSAGWTMTKPLSTRELKDLRVGPSELQLFATGSGSASDLALLLRECAALKLPNFTRLICYGLILHSIGRTSPRT